MKIEEVSQKDVNEIKEIARKAILESVDADEKIKIEIIADTLSHIDKNVSSTASVFLKCSDRSILGFILVQDYWNLSDLFVFPASEGKGIGKSLFIAAKTICQPRQDKGYIRVNSSKNAEGFYRKLGFETFTPEKEVPGFVVSLIYNF